MHWIHSLADITLADLDKVGSKAAHLGAMMRAGFPVPPGFVIDIDAFISHFGEVTDPLVRPNVPMLKTELMADVVQALVDHLGEETELAVRSSSTEEDGSRASFAGQHSTYYFVTPSRIDQAIIDCWMSLWSDPALNYRRSGWTDIATGEPVRMAVIVQQMLPATRSGVTFSRDPIDASSRDVVIEATWGLGAALVDGRVTPDHIRVAENGRLASYEISDKQYQVTSKVKGIQSVDRLQEMSAGQRHAQVLQHSEAEHIANLAQQLETLFDEPQDIEWAYAKDDLYLLQSRPITTRQAQLQTDRPMVIFKPLVENFTEPLTPISEDLFASTVPNMGAFYQGRLYIDIAPLRAMNVFALSETETVDALLLKSMPDKPRVSWPKALGALGLLAVAYAADGANWKRAANLSEQGMTHFKTLVRKIMANPAYDARKTLRRLMWGNGLFDPIAHRMMYVNISAGRYFILIGLLRALVERFAPEYPTEHLSRTYHGHTGLKSMSLISALEHLSDQLRSALDADDGDAELIAQVLDGQATALPPHHPFTEAFQTFLGEYGHRGPREMELAAPNWRETPNALLQMLHTGSIVHSAALAHGNHLAAMDELHSHLKPWQRHIVDKLIARISRFIALRENSRHFHVMGFDAVRQKVLQLQDRLLEHGLLKTPGDVFFLRYAEATDLQKGNLDATEAHEIVRRRRREWQRQCRAPVQNTINIDKKEADQDNLLDDGKLHGQCACPGRVEGTARLIYNLSQARALQPGEILIAPYTDPAWTPLFSRAGGVVVDTGSFLSHAGTVARELRVPCIVDAAGCMQNLQDGQMVRLDAASGTVEIVS